MNDTSLFKSIGKYLTVRKGRLTVLLLIAAAISGAYALDLGPTKSSQEAAVITSQDEKSENAPVTDETAVEVIDEVLPSDSLALADTSLDQGNGLEEEDKVSDSVTEDNGGTTDNSSTDSGSGARASGDADADSAEADEDEGEGMSSTNEEVAAGRKNKGRSTKLPRDPRMFPGGNSSTGGTTGGGGTTPTDPVLPTPDVTAPIATFVDALDGTTTIGYVTVRAAVIDPVVINAVTSNVREVAFFIDGVEHATTSATSAPGVYALTLNSEALSNGTHTFGVRGTDGAGNVGAVVIATVTVANPASDTTAPVVQFADALEGTTASGTLSLRASTSDPVVDGALTSGIKEVAFLVDGLLVATTSTSVVPDLYEVVFDTRTVANGERGFSIRAVDQAGNVSVFAYATVTVANIVVIPTVPDPFVRGGVSLTFDDANASQYSYVFPLLKSYNQTATLYVPTGFMDTDGYMSWGQIGELKNGGWEIGGHTVNHKELPLLTDTEAEKEVADSLVALEDKGIMATSFATPFGAYDPETIATIAQYYDSHRNFHHLALNEWPYNKYFLQIERVTSTTTPAEIASWVDQAIADDLWLIVVFHEVKPVGEPGDEWSWTTENMAEMLNDLKAKGVKTKTVADMLKHGDNLVTNGNFENGLEGQGVGWWTNNVDQVSFDTNTNGAYPEAKSSIKFVGNPITPAHLFGPMMNVEPAELYGIRFYVNAKDFVSGELGFYIDEYDASGNWISGKWLGQAGNSWVIDEAFTYTATSLAVAQVSLQVYEIEGSIGTAYIDSVEFFKPE